MYRTYTRRNTRIERLMCRWFGHKMKDGLKYHSSKNSRYAAVCQRCGFYEVFEDSGHDSNFKPKV